MGGLTTVLTPTQHHDISRHAALCLARDLPHTSCRGFTHAPSPTRCTMHAHAANRDQSPTCLQGLSQPARERRDLQCCPGLQTFAGQSCAPPREYHHDSKQWPDPSQPGSALPLDSCPACCKIPSSACPWPDLLQQSACRGGQWLSGPRPAMIACICRQRLHAF